MTPHQSKHYVAHSNGSHTRASAWAVARSRHLWRWVHPRSRSTAAAVDTVAAAAVAAAFGGGWRRRRWRHAAAAVRRRLAAVSHGGVGGHMGGGFSGGHAGGFAGRPRRIWSRATHGGFVGAAPAFEADCRRRRALCRHVDYSSDFAVALGCRALAPHVAGSLRGRPAYVGHPGMGTVGVGADLAGIARIGAAVIGTVAIGHARTTAGAIRGSSACFRRCTRRTGGAEFPTTTPMTSITPRTTATTVML